MASSAFGQAAASAGMSQGFQSAGFGLRGIINGAINNFYAKKAEKRQFNYNKQLMQIQNDMQRQLMSDAPELEKMAYKRAGISIAALNGGFSSAPSVPMATQSQSNVSAHAGEGTADLTAGLQASLIDSQRRNIDADTREKEARAHSFELDNILTELYGKDIKQKELDLMTAKEKEALKNVALLGEAAKNKRQERVEMGSRISLNRAQVRKIENDIDISLKTLDPTIKALVAQAYQSYGIGYSARQQGTTEEETRPQTVEISKVNVKLANQALEKLKVETKLTGEQIKNLATMRKYYKALTNTELQRLGKEKFENSVRTLLGKDFYAKKERVAVFNQQLDAIGKIIPLPK